ncbi:Serine/threonine-protein kinase SRPK [Lachnellula suecica]|uniref:EKC/KEOPS complex subunit BUD32 n=1 Tax=Lachnellula suecica TaxID=602035 RepID=A0A8T9CH75_9HELO|nr:Serine/threonine-protein kinase SRPK [Lachnellula suecica]
MPEPFGKSPSEDSHHGVDNHSGDGLLEQLYERGCLEVEDREEYRPGGLHPVHIGDKFGKDGRFRVIHKLGSGGLATVWLCRDQDTQKYVALKIIIADESRENSSELWLVNQKHLDLGEAGGEYIAVPHEYFWHDGPNGRHLCLVLPVLGPRVAVLWDNKFKDPVIVSQDIISQVTRGLHFLHNNGICHGDFRPSNILLRLTGFDDLSEDELINQLGQPQKEPLLTISGESPAPSGPEYLVEGLSLDRLDARFISDQICIIDFGESYDMNNPPEDLGITASFRSPELLFDNTIGVGCDLWALACTIYDIRTRSPLFENFMDDDDEVIMQMVPLLGKLPEPWWSSWEARGRWYEENGAPRINAETGKPFVLQDTLLELLTGISPSGGNAKEGRNLSGGFAVPVEESQILDNLLKGILKYDPEERLSVKAVLEHPWFES